MAVAALQQITEWGVASVAAELARVTATIAERTAGLGFDSAPPAARGPHLLGLAVPEDRRDAVVPALAAADCFASLRGGSLRIAPHLHTTDDDVDQLVEALRALGGGA
jgi:selenocysteine lyase/cysteine desulfurase